MEIDLKKQGKSSNALSASLAPKKEKMKTKNKLLGLPYLGFLAYWQCVEGKGLETNFQDTVIIPCNNKVEFR